MTRKRYHGKPEKCKKCEHKKLRKDGRTRHGRQIWCCKKCGYRGTMSGKYKAKSEKKCIICGEKHYGKGYCQVHYDQAKYLRKKAKKVAEERTRLEEEIFGNKERTRLANTRK